VIRYKLEEGMGKAALHDVYSKRGEGGSCNIWRPINRSRHRDLAIPMAIAIADIN
jgi:hypothetical protein